MIDFTESGGGGPSPEQSLLEKRCITCYYAVPMQSPLLGRFMAQCHRRPPTPILLVTGQKGMMQTHFPVVADGPEYFCGEYEPKTLHKKG